jgi:hypothetical protein
MRISVTLMCGRRRSGLPAFLTVDLCDFFVCGVSKLLRVNAKSHNKTAYLIPKIMEVMKSLARDTVSKAFRRFRSSSEAVVAADSHFID